MNVAFADINVENSCLGSVQRVKSYEPFANRLDFAITRTDNNNVACDGAVVSFIVITEDLASDDPVLLGISGGTGMDAADGIFAIDNYSEISANADQLYLSGFTTHQGCNTLGAAEVEILGGQAPYNIQWSNGATTAKAENLVAGSYTVTVTDANDLTASMQMLVETPLLNCDGLCPAVLSLINAIPSDTYQANGIIESSALIGNGKSVQFKAGVSVLLQSGFEVKAGAEFEVEIEHCID